jgi:ABC-type lipoprotein release transport system permease subunit
MILAFGAITWIGEVGIDLSAFTKGLTAWSLSPMLHPVLPISFYISITIMILITAVFSAIYPAVKAIKLKPAQAIRTY